MNKFFIWKQNVQDFVQSVALKCNNTHICVHVVFQWMWIKINQPVFNVKDEILLKE